MKLITYDDKHQTVLHEDDIGIVSRGELHLLDKVIEIVNSHSDRHRQFAICNEYELIYNDGEPEIHFG